jgi:hypothetical protein
MVDVASWGREEDIRAFIAKRFPQMYREKAKKLGLL